MPDISSSEARSQASTTARRTSARSSETVVIAGSAWTLEPGANRTPPSPMPPVVHSGQLAQLGGLLLRRRVAQEISAADLRAGEVLQQVRLPKGRVELDVEVEAGISAS